MLAPGDVPEILALFLVLTSPALITSEGAVGTVVFQVAVGKYFLGITLGVGFAAINSGANLLHAIFGALMALILGSGVLSESTLRRVRVRRVLSGSPHAA